MKFNRQDSLARVPHNQRHPRLWCGRKEREHQRVRSGGARGLARQERSMNNDRMNEWTTSEAGPLLRRPPRASGRTSGARGRGPPRPSVARRLGRQRRSPAPPPPSPCPAAARHFRHPTPGWGWGGERGGGGQVGGKPAPARAQTGTTFPKGPRRRRRARQRPPEVELETSTRA